jgi:hypothetical protein
MNVNATLVIQAGNFLMCYILLRWLLFKPAVALIQQEEACVQELRDAAARSREYIAQKEDERLDNWHVFHDRCLPHIPEVQDPELFIFKLIAPEVEYPYVSDDALDQLIVQTTDQLVKKVSHDYQ